MDIDNSDDFKISFELLSGNKVEPDELLNTLKPFAISIERQSPHRYEAILNDLTPKYDNIEDITWAFIQRLEESYPDAIIVSHVENNN